MFFRRSLAAVLSRLKVIKGRTTTTTVTIQTVVLVVVLPNFCGARRRRPTFWSRTLTPICSKTRENGPLQKKVNEFGLPPLIAI